MIDKNNCTINCKMMKKQQLNLMKQVWFLTLFERNWKWLEKFSGKVSQSKAICGVFVYLVRFSVLKFPNFCFNFTENDMQSIVYYLLSSTINLYSNQLLIRNKFLHLLPRKETYLHFNATRFLARMLTTSYLLLLSFSYRINNFIMFFTKIYCRRWNLTKNNSLTNY